MSKLLFVHDHVFTLIGDKVFSTGAFPSWAWDRYLKVYDNITVAARAKTVQDLSFSSTIDSSERNGVSFVFLPNASNFKSLVTGGGEAGRLLEKLVIEHDGVVARLSSELALLAVKYAHKHKKKIAVELVDCPWDSYWNYGGLIAKLYAPLAALRVKKAVRSADAVLYVTKSFLQDRYPCANGAISIGCSNVNINNISIDVLESRIKRITERREAVSASPVLGQISSLTGRFKGIQLMLNIIPVLKKEYPDIKYKVLGAGDPAPFEAIAEKLNITQHVEFCGVLPAGEPVLAWLDEIDIYVHPSLKEGLPRSLIEAMSRGCPAVASSVAGTPELLDSMFLSAPGCEASLLKNIKNLLSNKVTLENVALNNFNKSKEYSADILEERRYSFWKSFAELKRDNI